MNKNVIDSYLRNLLGVVLALVTAAMVNSGAASPFELGSGDWLSVLNGLWAAAIPVALRWINKGDLAFGQVAEEVIVQVEEKLKPSATKPSKEVPRKSPGSAKNVPIKK